MARASVSTGAALCTPLSWLPEPRVDFCRKGGIVRIATVLILLAIAGAADLRAQTIVSPRDRTELGLTVYQGFGMVRDTRRVESGARDIVWTGVARTLDPGTVLLLSGSRALDVASMVFEPDPGPWGLLQEGDPVVLVSPNGERIDATVASPGSLMFRAGDRLILEWKGHIEVPDPGGRRDPSPIVRWELAGPSGGGALTAAYLASGLSWSGDYVAVLEEEDRLALEGKVTVENHTGMTWPDAELQLVAGVVRRDSPAVPYPVRARMQADMAVETRGVADIDRQSLGEYHLYTVQEPVTLRHESTTQIGLFRAPRVPVERTLVLEGQAWRYQGRQTDMPPEHPEIRLRFVNNEQSGLGEPLPAGVIHVYGTDAEGDLQFLGDGSVPHTPTGEDVRIAIGQAFDITSRRIQTDWRRIDDRTEESAWRIEVANAGERARTVRIHEQFPGEWTILEESRPHERVDAQTARWDVEVPARGSTALTYRVRVAY